MGIDLEGWKARIRTAVDGLRGQLLATSHDIHANPELLFNEHHASARLADELERGGLRVERGVGGLATAFRAEIDGGEPGPTLAILAEYDALPGIGHACGHNIIATSALGAGLALARSGQRFAGRVAIIGTPGEEGGGGKILLAQAGVFDDVDASFMLHPSRSDMVRRSSLASSRVELVFHGKASHAAGAPDLGINALEAVIQTFVGVNARRLQMRADARVHGIITHGGDAVNIIPARASARFSVRARDRAYQRNLITMLRQAAEAGATSTGARLEWKETRGYDNTVPNPTIADVMARNMATIGRMVIDPAPNERMGSTDMGDISQILPAVHAYFAIVPETIANHTVEFATASASPAGDTAVVEGAAALAMTAAELLTEPALIAQAKAEFSRQLAAGEVAGRELWLARGREYTGAGTSE
ncbi:MAG TPA: M20 family metallopeptidase [Candidatus Acidoferrum sp.]|nr:M20 family metallopeptidase [Candidatus Acidoferrum sp.]